jgi:hypothetical protein
MMIDHSRVAEKNLFHLILFLKKERKHRKEFTDSDERGIINKVHYYWEVLQDRGI